MRALRLSEVREVLSGAQAIGFFEAWARLEETLSATEEQVADFSAQAIVVESRIQIAEDAAREATARAELGPNREAVVGAPVIFQSLLEREIDALAVAQRQRAARALHEAAERRQRGATLRALAAEAGARRESARADRARLRRQAPDFGGCVGESCLFFLDGDRPGAAFVVPLVRVSLAHRELEALVLHRLPQGAPLDTAVAIRDVPLVTQKDSIRDPETDPLTPPSEYGDRKKELP